MNQVKFKAWDKIYNKMRLVKSINYADDGFAETVLVYLVDGESYGYINGESCELLQYSGFKDKNGKKIYEGDILSNLNNGEKDVTINEIVFQNGCFCHKWLDKYCSNIRLKEFEPMFQNTPIIFEVIGNIYDNPRLFTL